MSGTSLGLSILSTSISSCLRLRYLTHVFLPWSTAGQARGLPRISWEYWIKILRCRATCDSHCAPQSPTFLFALNLSGCRPSTGAMGADPRECATKVVGQLFKGLLVVIGTGVISCCEEEHTYHAATADEAAALEGRGARGGVRYQHAHSSKFPDVGLPIKKTPQKSISRSIFLFSG